MTDIDSVEFRSQQMNPFDDDNDYKNLSSIKLIPATSEQILETFYENVRIVRHVKNGENSGSNASISQTVAKIDSIQRSKQVSRQNSDRDRSKPQSNTYTNHHQQQIINQPIQSKSRPSENQRPVINNAVKLIKACQPNNNNNQVINGFKKPAPVVKEKRAFQVIYGRYKPYKKNKEWSFDGFILSKLESIILYHSSGKIKGRTERKSNETPKNLESGTRIVIGGYECEVCDELIVEEFETGSYFAEDEVDDS